MNTLKIKVIGARGSGKTTIMRHIRRMLQELDIACTSEVCENIDTENLLVQLSKHDLAFLQGKIESPAA
jgi:Ni2+-binding GTPase involved in maturation of urease and hydrogenase